MPTLWHDIATAPRDGTEILLCRATDADNRPMTADVWGVFVQVASWWTDDTGDKGEWIVYCSLPNDPQLHFSPTHWTPLPDNPLW